ncbi:MAG: HYR domain-containing protein [Verrucomicrobia bacterium]|nr:HYR domain-containing protein [Verrucomicrobiota bacterium]
MVNYTVTASDNCAVSNLTCLPPSGTAFGVGVSWVYCAATDSAGLNANCSFTITVTDTTAPILLCPERYVVPVPVGQCQTSVEYPVMARDNGDPAPMMICLPPSGTVFAVGRTNVTCLAGDASGNTATCAFPVLVYPESGAYQPPVILGATNYLMEATGPTMVFFNITAINVCQPYVPVICDPPSGSLFLLGATPVSCVAVDAFGLTNTASFTVTVFDLTPPMIACPPDVTVNADRGQCQATGVVLGTATAGVEFGTVTVTKDAPMVFPMGSTVVTWIATASNGMTNSCAQTVTVLDGEPPTIICPADITFESTNSGGYVIGTGDLGGFSYFDSGYSNRIGGNVVNYGVTASDNCAVSNLMCLPPSGTPFAVGVSRVYCMATDSAGLSANCGFTITITDTTAPMLSCPGMLLVYVPSGLCETNVEFPVTAWDNGTPAPLVTCLPPSGSLMGVGQTNVTCVARDASGNTATCAFPVLVYPQSADHQPPVILGAVNQVLEAAGPTEVYFNVTATNACQPDIPVTCDPPAGSVFPLGVTPVFCVAVDAFNVTNTTSFIVALGSFNPPGIVRPPVSQWICLGSDCKFLVIAEGSPPLAYQWLFNGVEIPGATNSVLSLSNVPSFLAGPYKVEVSNPSGQVMSDDAFLTVNQPATITAQPQSLVVGTGDYATFTVGAEGTPPLTYQWSRDGRLMRGATNAQLLVSDAHNLGTLPTSYQVVVQNYCGKDTSDKVTLKVIAKPGIITQPQSVHYVCRPPNALAYNPYVQFTVVASGDNLKYQWYHGTSAISPGLNPWASQPTLILTNVSSADAGPYHVQVWNDVGGAVGGLVSAEAWLDVLAILSQPQGATNFPGSNVVLAVEAFGNNLQYQWTHGGFLIDGATNPVLAITNLGPTSAGAYQVTVLDNWDSLPSDLAMVSVLYPTLPFADSFADRGIMSGTPSGTGIGNNFWATKEPGETNHGGRIGGHSVWLTWVAPDDGVATFDTIGSSFDTVLAVYTGYDLSSLAYVASDDDLGEFHWSRVMFNAQAGFSYQVAVDSADQTVTGNIVLSWHLRQTLNLIPAKIVPARSLTVPPLASTNLCLSFGSVSGTSPVLMQWYRNDQPVGMTASNQNQSCLPFAQVTETNVGIYQAGIFRGTDLEYFLEPVEIQINTEGLNVGARKKLEDAKLLGLVGVPYPDSDLGGTKIVQPKSISKSIPKDWEPVSGYSGGQIFSSNPGKDPYEPNACGVPGGATYWFTYQPPEDGMLTINTDGSSYDTVLGVYYDDGLGHGGASLHEVACDNDSGTTHFSPPPAATSALTFLASRTTNYDIMVDGVGGAYGTVHLNYSLNTLPRIATFPTPQTIDQDTSTSALSFTNCDRETAVGSLVLTGTSSDLTLVPNANIVFGGSGTNRTVTVTPAAHRFGTNTITITVTDGGGASRSNSFTLRVVRVNHPPQPVTDTVVRLPNRTISIALAALLRNDTDPDGDPVTLTAVSARSQSGGFVTKGATFITYTPPAGFNSTDRFTYTVSDGQGGTATGAVYINVSSTTGQTTAY